MKSFYKICFTIVLTSSFILKTEAQISQSPNISLNKVFLNPAFAGSKGKHRISTQNSSTAVSNEQWYTFDYNYVSQRLYNNTSHAINYDGFSKKLGLGVGVSYRLTESSEKHSHSVNESMNRSRQSNINQYWVNNWGINLNHKIYTRKKEDDHEGTLSIGLGLSFSYIKELISNNYETETSNIIKYKTSINGNNQGFAFHKISAGLVYNIKDGYLATDINVLNEGKREINYNWGLMAGYSVHKKVDNPDFSFNPQIYINLKSLNKIITPEKYNFETQIYDEDNSIDTTIQNDPTGFYEDYTYGNSFINGNNSFYGYNRLIFKGLEASINLDFRYKKFVFGTGFSSYGVNYMIGMSLTNLKIALNYSRRNTNFDSAIHPVHTYGKENLSLSTNILF